MLVLGKQKLLFITKFTSPVLLPSATLTGTHLCLLFQPFLFLTPALSPMKCNPLVLQMSRLSPTRRWPKPSRARTSRPPGPTPVLSGQRQQDGEASAPIDPPRLSRATSYPTHPVALGRGSSSGQNRDASKASLTNIHPFRLRRKKHRNT